MRGQWWGKYFDKDDNTIKNPSWASAPFVSRQGGGTYVCRVNSMAMPRVLTEAVYSSTRSMAAPASFAAPIVEWSKNGGYLGSSYEMYDDGHWQEANVSARPASPKEGDVHAGSMGFLSLVLLPLIRKLRK
jgi:hypothetical protein